MLKHVFLDPPLTASMPKKLAKRVLRPKKSAHLIIVGYVGALYTAVVLGNHPVPVKLQRIFFESVR